MSRKEYTEGENAETVLDICQRRRSQALKILIASILTAVLILVLGNFILQVMGWLILMFAAIIGMALPFTLGNKEMKTLKKSLGLEIEKKVSLTDFRNAGAVHTLKFSKIIPPLFLGLLAVIASLLVDLKVIPTNTGIEGTFVCTGGSAIIWLTEFIIIIAAYIMDGLKNEVISSDSDINANYNRAKKKNLSNFTMIFLWMHTILLSGFVTVFSMFVYSEIEILICLCVYMVILIAAIILFTNRDRKIENRYKKEMTVSEDEDDQWIGGLIYYNPNNKRLFVKKRVGVGGTFNLAHPVGKIICGLIIAVILFNFGAMVYLGISEATPLKLYTEDNKIVCHHLKNDYEIDFDSVSDIVLINDTNSLKFVKIAGFGIDNLLKGSFAVNGESSCKVFLNPQNGNCIKVTADGVTYYIGGETAEETSEVFFSVTPQLKQLKRS